MDRIIERLLIVLDDMGHTPKGVVADKAALDLRSDLGVDSLDAVDLAFAAEQEFQIDMPDVDDLSHVATVGDLAKIVNAQLMAKEGRAA